MTPETFKQMASIDTTMPTITPETYSSQPILDTAMSTMTPETIEKMTPETIKHMEGLKRKNNIRSCGKRNI